MPNFATPTVVISRCIEIDPVRYNGEMVSNDFVKKLIPFITVIPVCPEIEIGLGTPREALRIIKKDNELKLIQPKTGMDFTEKMNKFAESFLDNLPEIDGFILKGRSPSSALKEAKIYSGPNPGDAVLGKGPGFFGKSVLEKYSHLALEEEGRLRNPNIKSNFLTKIFTLAKFRKIKKIKSTKEILKFHSENKLLLKAYNEKEMRILVFLKSLDDYKSGKIPLSVLTGIFKSWLLRFKDDYLLNQSFFEPYPIELADIDLMTSYCDGKDYWKNLN
ncbi:MAG: DUF523 and DUF1722 domain-containing protein [Candidatus Bathyarchaeota archaeon]